MSCRSVNKRSKKTVTKPYDRYCSLFHWLVAEIWLSKVISFAMRKKMMGFFSWWIFEGRYVSCIWLVVGLICIWTTVLQSLGFLCPGSSNSRPVCSSARAPCWLPTPSLTQREHPFFSFVHFFRPRGLVRWQWVLASAFTAVFTTQGSWMLTPPICLMRPAISFNSYRSLTPLPQQYKAKIGQVCYACFSMQWRYFVQVLKCLYYN